jgi:hypothetical protein
VAGNRASLDNPAKAVVSAVLKVDLQEELPVAKAASVALQLKVTNPRTEPD